jgi:tight adherence protein B
MKVHLDTMEILKYGGLALAGLGVVSIVRLIGFSDTLFTRYWARYLNHLDRMLGFLFLPASSKRIVQVQLLVIAGILAIELALFNIPLWYVLIVLVAVGPAVWLTRERKNRVEKLELQIDGFILALANSMKTVPGPAAALQAVVPVLQNPTRQEVERVIKEMRVGNTLEQALLNMSARIGSRAMDSALSALLIGLQVGGNLPAVLENTAATVREMNRLEGVVRTKTAEGRAQLWVLAVFPFAICAGFNLMQPGYFDPLQKSFIGYIIVTIAASFWIAALLVARKVLAVDI